MDNNKLKKIVIFMLIAAIFIMTSAYAILYQNLRINGNASVVASWKVEITGIKEGSKQGEAHSVSTPSYTASTASFDAQLTSNNDSIEYIVTIKNHGKINAKLDDLAVIKDGNSNIIYEITGVNEGDVLESDEEVKVSVNVKIDPKVASITETINSNVIIVFNYIQNV